MTQKQTTYILPTNLHIPLMVFVEWKRLDFVAYESDH